MSAIDAMPKLNHSYLKAVFAVVFIVSAMKSVMSHDLAIGIIFALGGIALGFVAARDRLGKRPDDDPSPAASTTMDED